MFQETHWSLGQRARTQCSTQTNSDYTQLNAKLVVTNNGTTLGWGWRHFGAFLLRCGMIFVSGCGGIKTRRLERCAVVQIPRPSCSINLQLQSPGYLGSTSLSAPSIIVRSMLKDADSQWTPTRSFRFERIPSIEPTIVGDRMCNLVVVWDCMVVFCVVVPTCKSWLV